jgi:uncharacterized protein (DUF2147 family)
MACARASTKASVGRGGAASVNFGTGRAKAPIFAQNKTQTHLISRESAMKSSNRIALLCLLLFAVVQPALRAADLSSPVGRWKTFDDKTGQPRGIVRIFEQDGKYFGRLEQSFTPGAETRVCAVCTDDRKNQPVIGLMIIRNVKLENGEYSGGDILDPDTGSVYRCKFHLEQNGARLVVRGFIGFSLLGRSQTWQREE